MIEFTRGTYDEVVHHADEGGDREVCGVLAGTHGAEHSVVTDVYGTENAAETPRSRYRIDPETQFEVMEAIEADGLDLVGFYHSHPTGPTVPSETDAERATWPDHSYVICALDGYPFVGSWRWRDADDAFEQETVAVADQH
ncbi:desampylase [Halopenitus persicus]|uniref:desampylase n=1 Tax=Halopenitus persicus TaxID=1048396 RepID=UPI000BBA44E4|nr:desampylase [Halopenitus persicus]